MGIFKNIFGSDADSKNQDTRIVEWKALTSVDQLSVITEASKTKPQAIFKHSTRCGVSRMVLKAFEADFNLDPNSYDLYLIDLLNYREVSSAVSETFDVQHQSPQLLIIKNGEVIIHDSHSAINNVELQQYV